MKPYALLPLALTALSSTTGALTAGPPPDPVAYLVGDHGSPRLLVRHEAGPGASVLLVHGATFPSAVAAAFRIDGTSWMDDLRRRGFDVWSFDFAGYGGSDRDAAFLKDVPHGGSYGGGSMAVRQVEEVVEEIRARTGHARVDVVAHSWGTIPAGAFAVEHPELIGRLVLFGPIGPRIGGRPPVGAGPALLVTRDDQLRGFTAGRPDGQPYMEPGVFDRWVKAYLGTDPSSGRRSPPSVRVPSGPGTDVENARSGHYPYDPGRLRVPTLLVRGDWDVNTTAEDMAHLAHAMRAVPGGVRTATLARGTHRMHLERNRFALFDVIGGFLSEAREPVR